MSNKRLKVLLSAYACEPGKGSEAGIGWSIAKTLAAHHNVWILTRTIRKKPIEQHLAYNPQPNLHFIYFDLPNWVRTLVGVQIYYALWQRLVVPLALRAHHNEQFDIVQHVTFGRYWTASRLTAIDAPFVWGPVGGGESAPVVLWPSCGFRGFLLEIVKVIIRSIGEHTPAFRKSVSTCALALATTPETAARLKQAGLRRVEILGHAALTQKEIESLGTLGTQPDSPIRFLSSGRLLHWKGFHYGIRAFAEAQISNSEYWILGDGPERHRLEDLAKRLHVFEQVNFLGSVPRADAIAWLEKCHVLVHPSLHDSGGWSCLEAMAGGRPLICLDLGGPATLATELTGIKVPALTTGQIVRGTATAMRRLAADGNLRESMSVAARERASELFTWEYIVGRLCEHYTELFFLKD